MELDTINTGDAANDATGDTLRDAFNKVNSNFELLNAAVESRAQAAYITIGTGAPTSSTETTPPVYWDETDKQLYIYDGTDWNVH